jgi:hypothetical protein
MLKILQRLVLVLALVAIGGCAEDFGQGGGLGRLGGWDRLGTQQVGPGADHDMFSVPGGRGAASGIEASSPGRGH